MTASLQARLWQRLEHDPDGRALAWFDKTEVVRWLSMADVMSSAAGLARRLAERGVRKGDPVVVVLASREPAGRALLAALLLGAVPLLVGPPTLQRFNADLLRILLHTVRKSRARLVIGDAALRSVMQPGDEELSGCPVFLIGEVSSGDRRVSPVLPASSDVAAMQLTSGTTALPRIAQWDHKGVLAAIDGMKPAMALTPDDVCFNWTPLYHDMGLVNNFFLCLSSGVPLVMMDPELFVRRPALWLRGLAGTRATLTWSPNFGFALAAERVRDEELAGVRLEGVRAFYNAAERIHLTTMETFHARFERYGVAHDRLKTNFGCVENIGGATYSDVDKPYVAEHVDRDALQKRGVARLVDRDAANAVPVVSAGRPYPGLKIEIHTRDGRPRPDGRVGRIALQTPSRMVGYLRSAGETKRAIRGEWLYTGDLGYMRDGEVFWVGRGRERINVRGKKLDPSDFETVLFDIDGLRQGCFAAFGVEDPRLGTQQIVVVSEVRQPTGRPLGDIAADIREQAFRRLDVKVADVRLVEPGTLGKTSSGKRRHNRFRQLYEAGELPGLHDE